jgi:hypothetical protein
MRLQQRISLPIVFLVLSNLVPVVGVVLWHWDVAAILILYWSENLIIGATTVIKMIGHSPIGGIFGSAFFVVHYGGFCAVHGLLLLSLLLNVKDPFGDLHWPFFFVFVELLVNVARKAFEVAPAERSTPTYLCARAMAYRSSITSSWEDSASASPASN